MIQVPRKSNFHRHNPGLSRLPNCCKVTKRSWPTKHAAATHKLNDVAQVIRQFVKIRCLETPASIIGNTWKR